MNDRQRHAARLLADYARDERPPRDVDARIIAYLREETRRREQIRRRAMRQWTIVAVAAATVLMVWFFTAFGIVGRSDSSAGAAAVHGQVAEEPGTATFRAPKRSATRPPDGAALSPPEDVREGADTDDPGVAALRSARDLLRAGRFAEAARRLDPCSETVGMDDLGEECEVLLIEALCGAGEVAEARRRIAVFRRGKHSPIQFDRITKSCPR